MSYRDDHDAALARVDALEAELARWHADGDVGEDEARAELARLEAEIKKLRKERDGLRPKSRDLRRWLRVLQIAVGALLAVGMVIYVTIAYPAARASRPVHAAEAAPSRPQVAEGPSRLLDCVAQLDDAIAGTASIGHDCVLEIELQAHDPTLGKDVHDLLNRWSSAEHEIFDGESTERRDQLAREIHAVVRPEFIR